jgi:predicted Rossmann fold nucleotide-binding protein DprA/Smf involved in DNA uptake
MRDQALEVLTLTPPHDHWPQQLCEKLGTAAPYRLSVIGTAQILRNHKVGLFCSVRCPGNGNLKACEALRKLGEEDVTVISGFHSPVEKECLRILLEGKHPVIVCPARALPRMRIPASWKPALEEGRLLILSRFERSPRRADKDTARRRNELVAALSDEVLIIHAEPGGSIQQISNLIESWHIPQRNIESI